MDGLAVIRRYRPGFPKQSLASRVRLYQRDVLFGSPGQPQIIERFLINGEKSTGSPVLGCHISDGGLVRQRKMVQPIAIKFNKFPNDALTAQNFDYAKDQVGGCGTLGKGAVQFKSNNIRNQHGHCLAEHCGLRLDSTCTPTEHPQAINHGRVRISPDHRIRIGQ